MKTTLAVLVFVCFVHTQLAVPLVRVKRMDTPPFGAPDDDPAALSDTDGGAMGELPALAGSDQTAAETIADPADAMSGPVAVNLFAPIIEEPPSFGSAEETAESVDVWEDNFDNADGGSEPGFLDELPIVDVNSPPTEDVNPVGLGLPIPQAKTEVVQQPDAGGDKPAPPDVILYSDNEVPISPAKVVDVGLQEKKIPMALNPPVPIPALLPKPQAQLFNEIPNLPPKIPQLPGEEWAKEEANNYIPKLIPLNLPIEEDVIPLDADAVAQPIQEALDPIVPRDVVQPLQNLPTPVILKPFTAPVQVLAAPASVVDEQPPVQEPAPAGWNPAPVDVAQTEDVAKPIPIFAPAAVDAGAQAPTGPPGPDTRVDLTPGKIPTPAPSAEVPSSLSESLLETFDETVVVDDGESLIPIEANDVPVSQVGDAGGPPSSFSEPAPSSYSQATFSEPFSSQQESSYSEPSVSSYSQDTLGLPLSSKPSGSFGEPASSSYSQDTYSEPFSSNSEPLSSFSMLPSTGEMMSSGLPMTEVTNDPETLERTAADVADGAPGIAGPSAVQDQFAVDAPGSVSEVPLDPANQPPQYETPVDGVDNVSDIPRDVVQEVPGNVPVGVAGQSVQEEPFMDAPDNVNNVAVDAPDAANEGSPGLVWPPVQEQLPLGESDAANEGSPGLVWPPVQEQLPLGESDADNEGSPDLVGPLVQEQLPVGESDADNEGSPGLVGPLVQEQLPVDEADPDNEGSPGLVGPLVQEQLPVGEADADNEESPGFVQPPVQADQRPVGEADKVNAGPLGVAGQQNDVPQDVVVQPAPDQTAVGVPGPVNDVPQDVEVQPAPDQTAVGVPGPVNDVPQDVVVQPAPDQTAVGVPGPVNDVPQDVVVQPAPDQTVVGVPGPVSDVPQDVVVQPAPDQTAVGVPGPVNDVPQDVVVQPAPDQTAVGVPGPVNYVPQDVVVQPGPYVEVPESVDNGAEGLGGQPVQDEPVAGDTYAQVPGPEDDFFIDEDQQEEGSPSAEMPVIIDEGSQIEMSTSSAYHQTGNIGDYTGPSEVSVRSVPATVSPTFSSFTDLGMPESGSVVTDPPLSTSMLSWGANPDTDAWMSSSSMDSSSSFSSEPFSSASALSSDDVMRSSSYSSEGISSSSSLFSGVVGESLVSSGLIDVITPPPSQQEGALSSSFGEPTPVSSSSNIQDIYSERFSSLQQSSSSEIFDSLSSGTPISSDIANSAISGEPSGFVTFPSSSTTLSASSETPNDEAADGFPTSTTNMPLYESSQEVDELHFEPGADQDAGPPKTELLPYGQSRQIVLELVREMHERMSKAVRPEMTETQQRVAGRVEEAADTQLAELRKVYRDAANRRRERAVSAKLKRKVRAERGTSRQKRSPLSRKRRAAVKMD